MANRTNPVTELVPPARISGHSTGTFQVRRGVKALVTSADRVLLVRERHADGTPFWSLPGGGAHPGEPLEEALRREVSEELCCRCVVGEAVDSVWYVHWSLRRQASVYVVLDCRLLDEPTAVDGEGIDEIQWVHPSELPPRTLPQVLSVVREVDPGDRCRHGPADTSDNGPPE